MIKRIHLRGYKSFADLDIELRSFTALLGPNGAGKSNLLDALQLLSRLGTSPTLKDAFAPPYRGQQLESFTFGPNGMRDLLQQQEASFVIEVDVELSPSVVERVSRQVRDMKRLGTSSESDAPLTKEKSPVRERRLRYRVEVGIEPRSGILFVKDEYLGALDRQWQPATRAPFLERMEGHLRLRMEKQAHPTYHDLSLPYTILSKPLYAPHFPHLVAMQEELRGWLFFYFEPRERMRAASAVKEVRHIALMGEELAAFLNTLKATDEAQFAAIEEALKAVIPSMSGIQVEVSELGEVELRLLEGERPIPARLLSEGTLRILGLLSLSGMRDRPSLIGFEEPENGINPRRIRLVAEILGNLTESGGTQLIVTTHSPILPDYLPEEALFVCRKEHGQTTIQPIEGMGGLWLKRDVEVALDAEEADGELAISSRVLRGDFDA